MKPAKTIYDCVEHFALVPGDWIDNDETEGEEPVLVFCGKLRLDGTLDYVALSGRDFGTRITSLSPNSLDLADVRVLSRAEATSYLEGEALNRQRTAFDLAAGRKAPIRDGGVLGSFT